MIALLEELNPWWHEHFKDSFVKREKYLVALKNVLDKKEVILLTGMRRVGKTTLLKQMILHLLEKEVPSKHILFLSLDLLAFSEYSIYDIIQEYKRLHKISNTTYVYLFLDEITYKKDFNQELKNLYDLGNYKIYASSSSASALSDNKAFLTGRSRYIEVQPLDFKEFISFKGYDFENISQSMLKGFFDDYMKEGGIPEYILTKDEVYLSELAEFIIEKDVISKHGIRNKKVVFDLYKLLCERVGKQISYNNLAKILSVDNETISRYVQYFLDTYLFYQIEVKDKINV
ncbi:MAG: ATP-binding protein, partial [Candidatus Woesearchaeota archaeon]